MPLHLLGKKSWNVYNADNIARVRRDEAAVKAAEEAEEQRMQEVDAQRRLAILRGEVPPPVEENEDDATRPSERLARSSRHDDPGGSRRKRKRHGEDDTEHELRLARERNEAAAAEPSGTLRRPVSSAPIMNRAGHIDLFGDERSRAHGEKNEEAENERRKKKREYEDQYTMRFSNAAGREGLSSPWYSQLEPTATPPKDVWGNEDPRRMQREAQRLVTNDPLVMMKKGAAKVREVKRERARLQEEREEELRQLIEAGDCGEAERRRGERKRRHDARSPRRRTSHERRRTSHERRRTSHERRRSSHERRRSRDGRDGGEEGEEGEEGEGRRKRRREDERRREA